MMQYAHSDLQKVPGLTFYKLMGSGKGFGFNPWPDWSVYCLLQVWESQEAADAFFNRSKLIQRYRDHASKRWTLFLRNILSRGKWSGKEPFQTSEDIDPDNQRLAIITRATIRWSKLRKFWSYVPTSQRSLPENTGLLYTKGIGEVPITQMATFSLWEDENALRQFAYESEEHRKAIQMTRELQWYKEELFARFQVIKESGESFIGDEGREVLFS